MYKIFSKSKLETLENFWQAQTDNFMAMDQMSLQTATQRRLSPAFVCSVFYKQQINLQGSQPLKVTDNFNTQLINSHIKKMHSKTGQHKQESLLI